MDQLDEMRKLLNTVNPLFEGVFTKEKEVDEEADEAIDDLDDPTFDRDYEIPSEIYNTGRGIVRVGEINATHEELVSLFGPGSSENDKSEVEWTAYFHNERTAVVIYKPSANRESLAADEWAIASNDPGGTAIVDDMLGIIRNKGEDMDQLDEMRKLLNTVNPLFEGVFAEEKEVDETKEVDEDEDAAQEWADFEEFDIDDDQTVIDKMGNNAWIISEVDGDFGIVIVQNGKVIAGGKGHEDVRIAGKGWKYISFHATDGPAEGQEFEIEGDLDLFDDGSQFVTFLKTGQAPVQQERGPVDSGMFDEDEHDDYDFDKSVFEATTSKKDVKEHLRVAMESVIKESNIESKEELKNMLVATAKTILRNYK